MSQPLMQRQAKGAQRPQNPIQQAKGARRAQPNPIAQAKGAQRPQNPIAAAKGASRGMPQTAPPVQMVRPPMFGDSIGAVPMSQAGAAFDRKQQNAAFDLQQQNAALGHQQRGTQMPMDTGDVIFDRQAPQPTGNMKGSRGAMGRLMQRALQQSMLNRQGL